MKFDASKRHSDEYFFDVNPIEGVKTQDRTMCANVGAPIITGMPPIK
jgi:hypothetical protein